MRTKGDSTMNRQEKMLRKRLSVKIIAAISISSILSSVQIGKTERCLVALRPTPYYKVQIHKQMPTIIDFTQAKIAAIATPTIQHKQMKRNTEDQLTIICLLHQNFWWNAENSYKKISNLFPDYLQKIYQAIAITSSNQQDLSRLNRNSITKTNFQWLQFIMGVTKEQSSQHL